MNPAALALAASLAAFQQPSQDTSRDEALRIFLDCQPWICDLDYLRTEITFVNYVRERTVADVFVLVTTQQTGAGGNLLTFTFIGQGRFAGRVDTLRHTAGPADTEDEIRGGTARVLRFGLVRFVAETPLARHMEIRFSPPGAARTGPGQAQRPRDRWRSWVFEGNLYANLEGERSQAFSSIYGSFSARRVTELWKLALGVDADESRATYEIDDTTTFKSRRDSWEVETVAIRSIGGRWSVGARLLSRHSSFSNLDLRLRSHAAIEYDVFPYRDWTRRALTFGYWLGVERNRYVDSTIYGRLEETRPQHGLDATFSARQPWGSARIRAGFSQYLHDRSKLRLNLTGNMNLRLVRGLTFNWFGGYSIIRDQLFLPAGGLTPEQIVARQRQLATGYSYFGGFGFTYTFGSIYNNVVNPRLENTF